MERLISILGATGSVGQQALDVARARGYKIDFLSANRDVRAMEAAAREFRPRAVAMADCDAASELKLLLADTGIKVYGGDETGIIRGIRESGCDTVVNAIIGQAGLGPTLEAIKCKKRVALANKESLVIAGEIVMRSAKENGVEIIPVDSEHCAIFQSLKSGKNSEIKKLILTASGGPFYGKTKEELRNVTLADTLAHPTWKMGRKITVDSATLMNKGFEVIEAAHLFGVSPDKIQVTVHRESILHSAVEYIDNSIVGEFSVPDMRMCVQYAVDYPDRFESASEELDLFKVGKLTFSAPDEEAFPFLALAKEALSLGGCMPAVMNAADEVAVAAFLSERISFTDIFDVVGATFDRLRHMSAYGQYEQILLADAQARCIAEEFILSRK